MAVPHPGAAAADDRAAVTPAAETRPVPPPPRLESVRSEVPIDVAVGLAPEAPGSKKERALLERLHRSTQMSTDPPTAVRRLRPGVGDGPRVCRERRDDLVLQIGYLPDRADAAVLAYDCRLGRPLGARSVAAVDEPHLVGALWQEHHALLDAGARERRNVVSLGPKARTALVASAVILVVGAALGLVLASTLREERVVLKVAP